jgi:peptide deformylase
MARLKIYTFPDPVLAQRAAPVDRVEARHRKLAEDMLETMYFAPGIGLAANQVGVLERIIVVDTEYESLDAEDLNPGEKPPEGAEWINGSYVSGKKPVVLINPEITFREGTCEMKEACLSVPDYSAEVKRSEKIKVRYLDLDGLQREVSAEGLFSVCLQHEMDHLAGTLFIDRLSPLKQDFAKKKLLKARKRSSG